MPLSEQDNTILTAIRRLLNNRPGFVTANFEWVEDDAIVQIVRAARIRGIQELTAGVLEGVAENDAQGVAHVVRNPEIVLIAVGVLVGISVGWEARKSHDISEETRKIVGGDERKAT